MMRSGRRAALLIAAATAALSQFGYGQATTFTWNGGGDPNLSFSLGANWGGTAPGTTGASVLFDGSVGLAPFNDLTGATFNSITFAPTAGSFSILGNALTLGNATFASNGIANNSTNISNVEEIHPAMTLAPVQNYITTVPGSGNLVLSGAITRQTGSTVAFNLSGGAIKTTLSNNASGIIGGWATIVTPSGSFGGFAVHDPSGFTTSYSYAPADTLSGDTTITTTTATSNILHTGGGNITVGSSAASVTTLNTMLFNEQGATNRSVTINGTLAFNAGGGIFHANDGTGSYTIAGGTITTNGTGELFVRTRISPVGNPPAGAPEGTLINSPIVDPAGGKLTFVKSGYGTLRLGATNPFSGGLFVNEGQLRPTVAGALGAGSVVCANGAFVLLGSAGTFSNSWFISGIGPTENGGQASQFNDGAIRFNSPGGFISGKVTLLSDSEIAARGGQATSTAVGGTVIGQITGNFGIAFNQFSNQGAATVQGNMPSVTLSNTSNNWTGNTTVGQGRLRMGASGVIPDGAGFGNLIMNGDTNSTNGYTILSLDGQTETVNGLLSSGINSQVFITNSGFGTLAGSTGTLIVGNNNASGTYGGSIVDDSGLVSITKVGTGTQTFSGANTYSGQTNINGGVLALASGATLPNSPIFVGAAGKLDVSGMGGLTLQNNQTLTGSGHVAGDVTMNSAGPVISPGTVGTAGTLSFDGALNLSGGRLQLDLSNNAAGNNDLLVANALNLSGTPTLFVNRVNGALGAGVYTIANFSSISGGTSNFAVPVIRQGLTLSQVGNSLKLQLGTGSLAANLTWVGDGSSNQWDVNNSHNWKNPAFVPNDVFFDWDNVTFTDSGSDTPSVQINGTVAPDSVTVNNSTRNYTFSGGGKISGLAGITKSGSGRLTIATTGGNDFLGAITINGGTLEIGDGSAQPVTIPTTAITNNAVLADNQPNDTTLANTISGSGSFVKRGSGTLTLSASSSYLGNTTISTGILRTSNGSALGSSVAGTYVATNAALDVNGQNLGSELITLQGGGNAPNSNGMLINTGADQTQAVSKVELLGVGTFGSSNNNVGGRLDVRGPTGVGGFFHGNGNDIFKVGASTFSFVGLMETSIGSIDIQQGMLQFERSTLGDPSKAVTIDSQGVLQLFGNYPNVNKPIVMNGGTILTISGESVYNGNLTVNGDGTINNNAVKMTINGNISGGSALRKLGTGTLVLAGTDSRTNDTSVVAGTLLVNGTIANGNVNTDGAAGSVAIGGSGNFAHDLSSGTSSVTFLPGGVLSAGTLSVGGNFTMGNGGTIVFDLGNTTTTGGGINDFVNVTGSIGAFGNPTMLINPVQGGLASGRYHLMQGSSFNGGFASVSFLSGDAVTNTRLTLTIDTSVPNTIDLVVGGSSANLNWNGPGSSATWDLKTTANFTGGPADNQFFNLDNVTFTGGAPSVTISGTLRPGAVTVNSAQSYTFAGNGVLTGNMTLTKSGSGQLSVSNPNTYTGGTQINGGTILLGVANALGTAPITIANTAGAVLNLGTVGQSVNGLSGGGPAGGEVKVGGGNFQVTVAYPNSNTYAGILSGTGTLTKAGMGSLTLTGSVPFTGGITVAAGGGKLIVGTNIPNAGALNINDQSRVDLASGGKLLGITTLNLNTTGVIDLNDGAMAIDYSTTSALPTVLNQIKAGLTDKSSIGPGNILSSAVSGGAHPTALGYADASVLGITSFAGKTVDNTTTLVRFTLVGDANLDLKANMLDFNAVATNFGGSGKTWATGDFNMDGLVNTGDFTALAQNFNAASPVAGPGAGLGTLVPEPIGLFGTTMSLLLIRRRRR